MTSVEHFRIDLYQPLFWLTLCAAITLLTPLTHAGLRKHVLALVNLGFLSALMGPMNVAWVLGGIAVVTAAAQLVQRRLVPRVTLIGCSVVVLSLFLFYKRPDWAPTFEVRQINPLLAAIGFSYVALRLWDMLRQVAEGTHPAPHFVDAVNYLLPFHMLAAGPIQAYSEFIDQPRVPEPLGIADTLVGLEQIAKGLFKKYVIAHFIQTVFLTDFRAPFPYFLLEVQLFYLWVYLDFSAYSDIALGVGKLIGVRTPENFQLPYIARNLIDFWQRWHISLSLFIRRNLFIPLQLMLVRQTGARYPLLCASIALAVSFLFCGIWHGVDVRWLMWGVMHASALVVANAYRAWLTQRLGRQGVQAYMQHRAIHCAAILITQEYVAASLVITIYPFGY